MLEPVADPAELWNKAVARHRAGEVAQAAALYKQVLAAVPGEPQVMYLLGLALYQLEEFDSAAEWIGKAVEARPEQALWQNQLGMALLRQGRHREALASLGQAVALDPALAEAHYNLGNALFEGGDFEGSAACFERALEANPQIGHAAAAHGQALHRLQRYGEAAASLRRAAELLPADPGVRCDLGDALLANGQTAEAVAAFEQAQALDPRLPRAAYSQGCAETERKNYAAAARCHQRALTLHPGWPEAQHNLAQSLFNLGDVDRALVLFLDATPRLPEAQAMIAVIVPGSPSSTNEDVLRERQAFAARSLPRPGDPDRFEAGPHGGRIRLGYVSSFFHRPNWMKPVWGLINHHDRERFEIHLFSDAPLSTIEGGYRPHPGDVVHDISELPNAAAAVEIEDAGIDLLIDLNGYSAVQRLPLVARHPAPIVCGWFNLFATSGIPAYDYLIGDSVVIPESEDHYYSERTVRVAGSYLTFEVTYDTPPVAAALHDPQARQFRFGCLAPLYKITPDCIAAWAVILTKCPGSSLTLKNRAFEWSGAMDYVRSTFVARGIPADRLRLLGPSPHYEFLETYGEIDLALDTFPYNGGTTTTEALWQGVPVLTFRGDRWVSRTSASLLLAAALPEFVARSRQEYVDAAVSIANSVERRAAIAELRASMRARLEASSVCDCERFARRMERIFQALMRTIERKY